MKKTHKQIEASRNTRLWITNVLFPATSLVVTLFTIPEIRKAASSGVKKVKGSFSNLLSKRRKKVVLTIDAKNQEEALYILEAMRREVLVVKEPTSPIKRRAHSIKKA